MNIFTSTSEQVQGLFKTFNLNFQDFPEPKSISRTFQVVEILQKNPGLFRRRENPASSNEHLAISQQYECIQQGLNRGITALQETGRPAQITIPQLTLYILPSVN